MKNKLITSLVIFILLFSNLALATQHEQNQGALQGIISEDASNQKITQAREGAVVQSKTSGRYFRIIEGEWKETDQIGQINIDKEGVTQEDLKFLNDPNNYEDNGRFNIKTENIAQTTLIEDNLFVLNEGDQVLHDGNRILTVTKTIGEDGEVRNVKLIDSAGNTIVEVNDRLDQQRVYKIVNPGVDDYRNQQTGVPGSSINQEIEISPSSDFSQLTSDQLSKLKRDDRINQFNLQQQPDGTYKVKGSNDGSIYYFDDGELVHVSNGESRVYNPSSNLDSSDWQEVRNDPQQTGVYSRGIKERQIDGQPSYCYIAGGNEKCLPNKQQIENEYSYVTQDWDGYKDTEGLEGYGDGQVEIEDGQLMLDCGTICTDDPIRVNENGIIGVGEGGDFKALPNEAIDSLKGNPIMDGLLEERHSHIRQVRAQADKEFEEEERILNIRESTYDFLEERGGEKYAQTGRTLDSVKDLRDVSKNANGFKIEVEDGQTYYVKDGERYYVSEESKDGIIFKQEGRIWDSKINFDSQDHADLAIAQNEYTTARNELEVDREQYVESMQLEKQTDGTYKRKIFASNKYVVLDENLNQVGIVDENGDEVAPTNHELNFLRSEERKLLASSKAASTSQGVQQPQPPTDQPTSEQPTPAETPQSAARQPQPAATTPQPTAQTGTESANIEKLKSDLNELARQKQALDPNNDADKLIIKAIDEQISDKGNQITAARAQESRQAAPAATPTPTPTAQREVTSREIEQSERELNQLQGDQHNILSDLGGSSDKALRGDELFDNPTCSGCTYYINDVGQAVKVNVDGSETTSLTSEQQNDIKDNINRVKGVRTEDIKQQIESKSIELENLKSDLENAGEETQLAPTTPSGIKIVPVEPASDVYIQELEGELKAIQDKINSETDPAKQLELQKELQAKVKELEDAKKPKSTTPSKQSKDSKESQEAVKQEVARVKAFEASKAQVNNAVGCYTNRACRESREDVSRDIQTQIDRLDPEKDKAKIKELRAKRLKAGILTHSQAAEEYRELAKTYDSKIAAATKVVDTRKSELKTLELEKKAIESMTDKDKKKEALKEYNKKTEAKKKELEEASKVESDLKKEQEELSDQGDSSDHKGNFYEEAFGVDYYSFFKGENAVGDIASGSTALLGRLGSYRSLSNLLMPDATKEWMELANNDLLNQWADLSSTTTRQFCDYDDARRSQTPGEASSFFLTQSGTYQFVGAVKAEKSPQESFILCQVNSEDEEDFICPKGLECVNEEFCHKEGEREPAKGTFYKITWRVNSPVDEKFTPYVDENGFAIKFNVALIGTSGTKWMYKRLGFSDDNVIELKNGATDGATIAKHLIEDYNKVCIKFGKAVKDREGNIVSEICTDFITSTKGEVKYGDSARTQSVTTSSSQVELDI